ncbi:MAG: NACHT domain-containing protein, partial [Coleofasciculaceae cyanobacterium]
MRRPTQGQVIKKRVWCFIEALLTHAEDSPDFEVHWETDKSTERPIFVVNTKRRFLESLTQLKTTELTEVIKSLESLKIWDDRRLKRGKGSPIGAFALKLWSRDAERNHEQFERVWEANRPEKSKALEANYQKSEQFDWQNICRTILEKQKQLTSNRLMQSSEMTFDLSHIYVDLALVERKKQDKPNGDDYPEKSHSYKPDYEETQKFEYEAFIAILKSTTNNKIALIGEPGAGKTTLLQRIAFWILDNTNDLVIWIPLGNLPTTPPNFKDYLLDNWLQNAINPVTPEIKADFDKQLTAGKVWLLLDGVDEMATVNALSFINNWLPAWSHNLHFVLTCRLNVWEANPYLLNGLQTYRTLEFNQEQVKQFINNCFHTRRGARP